MRLPPDWRLRVHRLARDVLAMAYALRDPKVSRLAKVVADFPLIYLIMPMDLIPDVIPVVGWLDDLAMLPLASYLFGWVVPGGVLAELRGRADRRLLRWGPRVIWGAIAFFCLWLVLAGIGGWFFVQSLREAGVEAPVDDSYMDILFR